MLVPGPKREEKDFNAPGALLTGVALAAFLVLLAAGLSLLQKKDARPPGHRDETPLAASSPLNEAEFEAGTLREALNGPAIAKLGSYGWVNRAAGIARIPVARAIELLAEKEEKGAR